MGCQKRISGEKAPISRNSSDLPKHRRRRIVLSDYFAGSNTATYLVSAELQAFLWYNGQVVDLTTPAITAGLLWPTIPIATSVLSIRLTTGKLSGALASGDILALNDLEVLKERVRAHPAARGGPADEGYWLDLLEFCLAEFGGGLDALAKIYALNLESHPEKWQAYIAASRDDLLAFKTLQVLLANMRGKKPGSISVSPEEATVWRVALKSLDGWAQDVALENIKKPKDRPDKRKWMLRDASIAATVNGIHDLSGVPYEFDEPKSGEPRSACHIVADRLGKPYATVRSIWRKERDLLNQAREHGLIPSPRPKQRRT